MASTVITKTINASNIDSIITSLKKLTDRYPQDEALKYSLTQYENMKVNA